MHVLDYVDAPPLENGRPAGKVKIYAPEALQGMRAAGKIAAACLDMLAGEVKAGVTTLHLDDLAREFLLDHGALPACVFYRGYRHTICTSLNHVVCHGIPGDRGLREGDILNIDVTSIVEGWHGDTSRMYAVPPIRRKEQRLMDVTYESMMAGIAQIKPGATLGDVGAAIQRYVERERMSVVRDFCGHGVGAVFHDAPNVLHYGKPNAGLVLRPGMMFTVEPMVNAGGKDTKTLKDGWTAVTKDKEPSAQFEHSVAVTESGVEIFTESPAGLHQPHKLAGG